MAASTAKSGSVQKDLAHALSSVEKVKGNPGQRLALAKDVFNIGERAHLGDPARIPAYQEAVKLDPFNGHYRLVLGRAEHEEGLLEEAVSEYRRALEYWPDWNELNLLLAEALIDSSQPAQARELLEKIQGESDTAVRAAFDRVECAMREARAPEDWKKILDLLGCLPAADRLTGMFCEKVIKLLTDCEEMEICTQALDLARAKVPSKDQKTPAFRMLERLARFKADEQDEQDKQNVPGGVFLAGILVTQEYNPIEGLLTSYVLRRKQPVQQDDLEESFRQVGDWNKLVKQKGCAWPGLQDAYVAELDDWAAAAYRKKNLRAAAVLWGEIGRVSPGNLAALHNLALVHTRLKDEKASDYYWDQLTRAWTRINELAPGADRAQKELMQKHQVFVEGAQEKLQMVSDQAGLIELGMVWSKELISYLAVQQVSFRNAYFRCGVIREDFLGPEQRETAVGTAAHSLAKWLAMTAEWSGLQAGSPLVKWREQRLNEARQTALHNSRERYRYYDQEKEAFQRYREYLLKNYIMLLFRVMIPISNELDLDDAGAREKFKELAVRVMSFPHALLKPGVLKVVAQMEEDTDMEQLALNYAVGPWFKRAQELMQAKKAKQALPYWEEIHQIAPGFTVAYLYHAQCLAEEEKFPQAYKLLVDAKNTCRPEGELAEQLDHFIEQMDVARLNKSLKTALSHMEKDPAKAVVECYKVDKEFPNHPYVLFVLGQALMGSLEIGEAEKVLARAKEACGGGHEDLAGAIDQHLEAVREHGADMILSKAVEKMHANDWNAAIPLLAKGSTLPRPDARISFYTAICYSRLNNAQKAEEWANVALHQCDRSDTELRDQINNLLEQIPLMLIEKELSEARKAMDRSDWNHALPALDRALNKVPYQPLVLFYKAVCYFRLGLYDSAEQTAHEAQLYCGADMEEIADQLRELLNAIPNARNQSRIGPIIDYFNQGDFFNAWMEAMKAKTNNPNDPQILFLCAAAQFRSTMKMINDRSMEPTQSLFTQIETDLDEAYRISTDRDLDQQIKALQGNVAEVKNQLRRMGIY